MDINGRAEYIKDYLVQLHSGQWLGRSDANNKVYANLVILDDSKDKPSESDCTNGLATMQSNFDNKEYSRNRANEYPSIADQLDDIYHNGIDAWKATIKVTKDKYPK